MRFTITFGHVMQLALASCDMNRIVNEATAFLWSRQSNWGATWTFGHVMLLTLALTTHDVHSIINSTIAFLRWRQSKWSTRWLFGYVILLVLVLEACAADSIINYPTAFLYVKTIEMRCNMTLLVVWCYWYWCQHYMMLMASSVAPLYSLGQDKIRCNLDIFGHICHWHQVG